LEFYKKGMILMYSLFSRSYYRIDFNLSRIYLAWFSPNFGFNWRRRVYEKEV